ncbi:MAG TPA: hypothetical protein VNW92_19140 [Polyangiaceae bacterium]|nr:hypothetical protein [Polyangiaceae bacterium]
MRPGFRLRSALAALSCAVLACAGRPAATDAPATPARVTRGAPASARERLAQALRSIPRPLPVLDALPEDARKRLAARLAGLDAERKLSVHNDDSPLVESLPLLHLASGGTSPRALFALATTSAGAEELSGLLGVEHDAAALTPAAARVAIVRELARRAALDFLRDRAADVLVKDKGAALVCRLVARVALGVGRRDVVLMARELLVEAEPSSENRLEFAAELARSADPERAEQALAEASRDQQHPPHPAELAAVQQAIGAARFVAAQPAPSDVPGKLALARAWLHLGRMTEARALLEPEAGTAKSHLGLAAALAETLVEQPSCPELPPDVGTAPLCAESFLTSERVEAANALLEAAWKSAAGRDDEAIEVYAALAHIIPWMHRTAFALSHTSLSPVEARERVAALHAKIQEIVAAAPRLAGLALFVETLRSGVTASDAARFGDADAQALVARALGLAASDSSRFAQAGVLAVAAALSHQRDISPLVDAVPLEQTVSALRVPRAALGVWVAASLGEHRRMDSARSELAAIMSEGRGASLERARLVLSVSEADALLDGSERSYQLLSRVSGQLLQDSIPPDLAFRAVLDASGALAHGKRLDRAKEVLEGAAAAQLPADLDRAKDLLQLIRGYKLVLSVDDADAAALGPARTALSALAPGSGSESAGVWFELWTHELEARERDALCQKRKQNGCREASALRRVDRHALEARLGAESSAVLLRGALPGGFFDAGFRFSAEAGLEPFIVFDPSLLAIGLPKFTAD